MKERTNKIKNWFEEHKEEIKIGAGIVGLGALCTGAGYFVGSKLTELYMAIGLQHFHDTGLMKFFDPRTGIEISAEQFPEVAKAIDCKK